MFIKYKRPLYAPMLSTFGGGSIRGFVGAGGGASDLEISDVTITSTANPSFPTNMSAGSNYPSVSVTTDTSNNRAIIRQTQLTGVVTDAGPSSSAVWAGLDSGQYNQHENTDSFNGIGHQYSISGSGQVWIALQGGGGQGGISGYGGSGGGSGGFVLVKVDLSVGTGTYYVRVAHGYIGMPSSFSSNDYNHIAGVASELYRGTTLLARAEGGQGGVGLNTDSITAGGNGGGTSVISDDAIISSYTKSGSAGGTSTGVNSANLGGGASPPLFTYTNPSTTINSGTAGAPLLSTYRGSGNHDARAGDGVVGSIGPNTWQVGYSGNGTNGDLVNNDTNGGGNTAGVHFNISGYMGGGSGGQDRANSNYYGTFNSPGFVAIYGGEAIS